MRIVTVIGNRPQFVKAAAVSRPLRERHEELIVHTGQHYDDELSRVFFEELSVPAPDRELDAGGGTNTAQTARILAALEPVPEELNRVLTDHASNLLLCSTDTAMLNLEREGVRGESHLVGDVMADVSLAF